MNEKKLSLWGRPLVRIDPDSIEKATWKKDSKKYRYTLSDPQFEASVWQSEVDHRWIISICTPLFLGTLGDRFASLEKAQTEALRVLAYEIESFNNKLTA